MKEYKIEITIKEEDIQELFEVSEVRFSQAKLKQLMSTKLKENESEINSMLENTLLDALEGIINMEWKK